MARELVEHLVEKHECMSYEPEDLSREQVVADGQTTTMLRPTWLPAIDARCAWVRDELLFVLGTIRSPNDRSLDGEGALLIGRRQSDGVYVIYVWHALYRSSLAQLLAKAE